MKSIALFLSSFLLIHAAQAYRIEWGRKVTITKAVYEDLYVAGGTIILNAPVYGDVIVAGGTINLNDTITNDLLVAGGTVYINGYVADDIRCAGGELHVLKNIGGDLVITGGKVDVAKDVIIRGGFVTGGGEVVINGTVNSNVKATGGNFTFNGTANKDFDCRSDRLTMNGTVIGISTLAARHIVIGTNASFSKPVRYWTKDGKIDFGTSLKNGSASYDPSLKLQTPNWYYLGRATALGLVWYLATVFLFIMLFEYLFRKTFKKAGDTVFESALKSLGWGFLFFVGVPFLVLFLLITIIGIPIGVIVMLSYIGLIILATIITSLVIANWYNDHFMYNWGYWKIVFSAMALFIIFKLVSFTPFLGWMIMFAVVCIAFGAILRNIDWRGRQRIAID